MHDARIFVRDTVFNLTSTMAAGHLSAVLPLSDVGIHSDVCTRLEKELGLKPETVSVSMTLEQLAQRVANESSAKVTIVKQSLFEAMLG